MRPIEEDPDFIPETGGSLHLEMFPDIRIDVPKGAVLRTTQLSLQILPMAEDFQERTPTDVACSPIVTLCPARRMLRKFFKLSIPFPKEQFDSTKEVITCFIRMSRVDQTNAEWEDIGKNITMTTNLHAKVAHISSKLSGREWAEQEVEIVVNITHKMQAMIVYWVFIYPKTLIFDAKAVNFLFDSVRLDREVKTNKAAKNELNLAISTDDDAQTSSMFYSSIRAGDLERVKHMLESGEGTLLQQEKITGWTALHVACIHGHAHLVTEFINRGAYLNGRTKKGNTPLHLAVTYLHSDVVKLLLDNGATSDLYSPAGFTPLHLSIINGCDEILTDILQYDHTTNLYTEFGQSAMQLALQYKRKTTISILLVHLSNRSKHNSVEALKELVCVIDSFEKSESKDNQFADAFHLAEKTVIKCVNKEVQAEIDNIQKTSDTRIKPYLVSSYTGDYQGVHNFIKQRCIKEVVANKEDLMTALHCACLGGHEDIVTLLLKEHHPINCQTLGGYTPLFFATRIHSRTLVDLLIEHGADVHIKNKIGCSPWLYAKADKNEELAVTLSSLKTKKLELAKTEKLKRGSCCVT